MFNTRVKPPTVSQSITHPSPTGGVNDLDPIANMGEQFLIDAMNFFPDTGLLTARPGYREWATGFGGPVRSIIYRHGESGPFQKFAVTDGGVHNIDVSTETPTVVHALTNGRVSFTNLSNPGKTYMVGCNGVDPAFAYDGVSWVTFTESASPTEPGEIDGVDPSRFSYVLAFKHRLYFVERNSMTVWYLPLDQIGGTAEPLYLGGVFTRGGKIVALARWSSDTGAGLDDRLVIITSAGEVASYHGSDPSNANDWGLDAVFYVAPPISDRAIEDYGGDVIMLTRRGLVPLSTLISGGSTEVLYSGALTRRISRTLLKLTSDPAPRFPGSVKVHNDSAWIVINLFDSAGASAAPYDTILSPGNNKPIQLVMNFLTGAWTKFDYPMCCMQSMDGDFYMGTEDGRVLLVTPDLYEDDVKMDGLGGKPIELYAVGAYSYLGTPTNNKHVKFVRPVIQSNSPPNFKIRVLPNFKLLRYDASPSASPATGNAVWDQAVWDQAMWGRSSNAYTPWVSANVLGYAFSWQFRASTNSALGLSAVGWVWENGGYI